MQSLTALTMENVSFPSTSLPHLPMLDHPHYGRGPGVSSLDIQYWRINRESNKGVAQFLQWLSQSPSRQTLRALTFYPGTLFFPSLLGTSEIVDFLRAVSPSVEHLTTTNVLGTKL